MRSVDIQEAAQCLSRLIEAAAEGDGFVITRGGIPVAKVESVTARQPKGRRIGFLAGEAVPDDFDRMGKGTIDDFFQGGQ